MDDWLKQKKEACVVLSGLWISFFTDGVCLSGWTAKIISCQAVWQVGRCLKLGWLIKQSSNSWRSRRILPGHVGTMWFGWLRNVYTHRHANTHTPPGQTDGILYSVRCWQRRDWFQLWHLGQSNTHARTHVGVAALPLWFSGTDSMLMFYSAVLSQFATFKLHFSCCNLNMMPSLSSLDI